MTTCFVIGPIGDPFAPPGSPGRDSFESALELYERVIVAACNELGIEAVRADQISLTGDITEQVFRRLYESDVVIADLTGGNPNVMYELGLRHSRSALTIPIADKASGLPFDVNAVRTLLIDRTPLGLIEARKALVRAIQTGLQDGSGAAAATRVWEAARAGLADQVESVLGGDSDQGIDRDAGDEQKDGYLELIVKVVEAFPSLTSVTETVTLELQDIGSLAERWTAEITRLNSADAKMSVRLKAIHDFASELGEEANSFQTTATGFHAELKKLDASVSPLLVLLAENPHLQNDSTKQFFDQILVLATSARSGLDGLGNFASSAQQLGSLSKTLRPPAAKISSGVGRMAEGVSVIENWAFAVERIQTAS